MPGIVSTADFNLSRVSKYSCEMVKFLQKFRVLAHFYRHAGDVDSVSVFIAAAHTLAKIKVHAEHA